MAYNASSTTGRNFTRLGHTFALHLTRLLSWILTTDSIGFTATLSRISGEVPIAAGDRPSSTHNEPSLAELRPMSIENRRNADSESRTATGFRFDFDATLMGNYNS